MFFSLFTVTDVPFLGLESEVFVHDNIDILKINGGVKWIILLLSRQQ